MNVFASLLLLASVSSATSFTLDFNPGGSIDTLPTGVTWFDALTGPDTGCSKRGTLQINMTGHTSVKFDFTFAIGTRSGWLMNIGDSSTNDGDGGDDGTQDRNCEAQVNDDVFKVYQKQSVLEYSSSLSPSNVLSVIVRDGYIEWSNSDGVSYSRDDTDLYYALGNQSDSQGVNKDIYLGMNQVVKGGTKNGTGLCIVTITFDV